MANLYHDSIDYVLRGKNSLALWTGGLMHFREASTNDSLCMLQKLYAIFKYSVCYRANLHHISTVLCGKKRLALLCEQAVYAFAKSIDPCQPAQSAQADMGRNFSLCSNFLHVKGPFYISRLFDKIDFYGSIIRKWTARCHGSRRCIKPSFSQSEPILKI